MVGAPTKREKKEVAEGNRRHTKNLDAIQFRKSTGCDITLMIKINKTKGKSHNQHGQYIYPKALVNFIF